MVKQLFFRNVPLLTVLSLVLIIAMPFQITGYSMTAPFLSLAAVCYWSIFSPTLLPFYGLFFLGLLQDILSNPDTLGLNAGLFLLVRMFLELEKRFFINQGFIVLCLTLGTVTLICFLIKILIVFFLADASFSINPFILQYIFTLLLMPSLIWVLMYLRSFLTKRNLF